MWIAENSAMTLQMIENMNKNKTASVSTHDFSTLYTKIPLDDLKLKIKKVIEKAFKGGQKQNVMISKHDAYWYSRMNKDNVYSLEDILMMLDILINNLYFQLGDDIFRQRIGIPMGIDPAPYLANLYLYHDESAFLEEATKKDYGKARKYNHVQRFIDDLCTFNNDDNLEKDKGHIYHQDLQLNKENDKDDSATFLDLQIDIKDKMICTKTYDKRDAFKFDIVSFPDLSGNIPTAQSYGVFISQLHRHATNCTKIDDFVKRSVELVKKLLSNNYKLTQLQKTMTKFIENNHWVVLKYECTKEKLKKLIFPMA
jgi:hypothetical protein